MKNMRDVLNEIAPEQLTSGELIKSLRTNFKITQDQICEVTGLQRANLSAIENGRLELSVHYAVILSAALGVHPSTILFPDGHYEKSKEILKIERKAQSIFKKLNVG